MKLKYKERLALKALIIVILLTFPTSFFLVRMFRESLIKKLNLILDEINYEINN
jgi:hypothetical protein